VIGKYVELQLVGLCTCSWGGLPIAVGGKVHQQLVDSPVVWLVDPVNVVS